jgi:lipase chaperone LimK
MRLAHLDQQQQEWQQRLSDYQQEKSRIVQAGLSETDQVSAITRLREQLFDGPERLRVRALDAE